MSIPDLAEIKRSCDGAWRLLKQDESGLSLFDDSIQGFWRSFVAALYGGPAYLILVVMRDMLAEQPRIGGFSDLMGEFLLYIISWFAFPLVMVYVAERIGREAQYLRFIVAFNWASFIQIVVLGAIGLFALPAGLGFLFFLATLWTLFFDWSVARQALDLSGLGAVGIVALNLVLGLAIYQIGSGLLGAW